MSKIWHETWLPTSRGCENCRWFGRMRLMLTPNSVRERKISQATSNLAGFQMSLYVWIYSTEILPTCSISRLLLGAMSRMRNTQMAQAHHNHDSRQAKPKLFVFQIKIELRRETSLSWVLKGVLRKSSFRLLILQYYCFRFIIRGKPIYPSLASIRVSILNNFYMLNK